MPRRLPQPDEPWRDLGCSLDPCRPEPDPTLFFAPTAVASLLDSVVDQLRRGPGGLFAVLGETGAGKSMLLRVLEAELIEAGIAVVFHECDADDDRWEAALAAFGSSSGRCVLLVDGAEMWDERAVAAMEAALAALGAVAGSGKQVVVGGRAALETRLQRLVAAGFAANLTFVRLRLDPIDGDQVGAFLLHRLRKSGYAGDQPLTAAALRRIGADSGGAPRRILELAAPEFAELRPAPARRIGRGTYAALALAGIGAGVIAWRAMEHPQAPAAPVAWAAAPEAATNPGGLGPSGGIALDGVAAATGSTQSALERVAPGPEANEPPGVVVEAAPLVQVVLTAEPATLATPPPGPSQAPSHEPAQPAAAAESDPPPPQSEPAPDSQAAAPPGGPPSASAAEAVPLPRQPDAPQSELTPEARSATQPEGARSASTAEPVPPPRPDAPQSELASDAQSAPTGDALLSLAEILEIAPAAGGEQLAQASPTAAAPTMPAPQAANPAAEPKPTEAAPSGEASLATEAPREAARPAETTPAPAVAAPAPPPSPAPPPQESATKAAPAVAAPAPPAQGSPAGPAAAPTPDARRALSAAQAEAYLGRAQDYLRSGDVAAARLLYERLAAAGDARGMTELGRTYDPNVLSRWGVVGLAADPQRAEHWYRKAAEAEAAAKAKSP